MRGFINVLYLTRLYKHKFAKRAIPIRDLNLSNLRRPARAGLDGVEPAAIRYLAITWMADFTFENTS